MSIGANGKGLRLFMKRLKSSTWKVEGVRKRGVPFGTTPSRKEIEARDDRSCSPKQDNLAELEVEAF